MPPASIPENESARLANLRMYNLLDTLPEVEFEDITRLAARICGTPTALISLVDENRQWFKSKIGMEVAETSRDLSFCAHAILGTDLLIVPDTLQDQRFAQNGLVTGNPNIRFYAGVPLTTAEGFNIGTLCVLDQKPRALTTEQAADLQALSRLVLRQLQLRRHLELQGETIQQQQRAEEELEKRVSDRTAELLTLNHQLTKAKEAAEAGHRAKANFLRNMSHELRTPLNGILGSAQILLSSSPMSAEGKNIIAMMQESAESLTLILNDILDLADMDSGKLEIEHRSMDVRQIVQNAVDIFRPALYQKGVALSMDVPLSISSPILADARRVRQVLVNLIGNAVKFTEKGGEVRVSVNRHLNGLAGPFLCFTVADSGIGIPEERQSIIFEPFTQLDGSRTRRYGGIGSGLTICAQLAALMQGTIWVESQQGKGSAFHFLLPEAQHRPAELPVCCLPDVMSQLADTSKKGNSQLGTEEASHVRCTVTETAGS